jgi:ubiquinone biosynthesis protein COQ4
MTSKMTWAEAALVLGAIGRVLRDSNRIDDIHLVADITGRTRFQRLLARVRSTPQGQRLLRQRPTLGPDDIDLDALRALGPDPLGGAFARHLQAHRLELYEGPPSSKYLPDPDVRYLVHRYRQLHDIWHVLLGLGTAGHEEVLVHAFTLGHLGVTALRHV